MKITSAFGVSVAGFVITLGFIPCCRAQMAGQVEKLVRASHIIFVGRVEQLHAANLKVVSPTESTILVRVEEPLDVPSSVASLKGEQVTVQVTRSGEVRPGETEVFFTNGLVFGEHLEVKEVGHISSSGNTAELRKQILAVRAQIAEEILKARANGALLVVTGKVLEVKPLANAGPRSEHEPDWAEALVQVDSVEKGALREKTVIVDFPRSTDERWLTSPKFKAGESGIWLLRHQENVGLPPGAWSALNVLDFQPMAQKETVRKLLMK
jgi:hypothetical protein